MSGKPPLGLRLFHLLLWGSFAVAIIWYVAAPLVVAAAVLDKVGGKCSTAWSDRR